ncbi:phosphatidate cytidylyltransferase [Pseudocnuella soli]|uniref:phosphatidate cytidylyltransferase n=1 Tax=Pseudocnuella soli TaxID=2502779 RepID=UPI0010436699|nr:phosphatidate cytidylyltransferase [Pseudocnuella soli]
MAFNWQTFRTRALSSVVFVAVMAAGLLWNEWSFLLLFSAVHFGCWWEYYRLVKHMHQREDDGAKSLMFCFALLGWGLMLIFTQLQLPALLYPLPEIGLGMVMAALAAALAMLVSRKNKYGRLVPAFFAGLLYISLSLALLMGLRTRQDYPQAAYAITIPLLVIVTNWINDTMAYIVGSLIGKTPFSPISPKKTWEGTIGGAVLAVLTISLVAYFSGLLPVGHAAALAALGAISGTYGDLFESKLKRMAGVKDSGSMMPGHGGFLDRFDSLLFSATVCAVYVGVVM